MIVRVSVSFFLPMVIFLMHGAAFSQDLNKAKKMFLYERWASAKSGFKKSSASSHEAAYWYIQALIQTDEIATAKEELKKAKAAFPYEPLIAVASAHIDLLEGRTKEARAGFDNALTMTNSVDRGATLNAIGRSHGTVAIRFSDPDYAISKLTEASKLEPANGSIMINMGDCYRNKLNIAKAFESYQEAMRIDPSLTAISRYKIGNIYAAQENCAQILDNYTAAVAADPNFMPAFRALYESFSTRESSCFDKQKAIVWFDKCMAVSDKGAETDMLRVSFAYQLKDHDFAIDKAQALIASMKDNAPAKLFKICGYSFYELGEHAKAAEWMEKYFTRETDKKSILTHNYSILAWSYEKLTQFPKAKLTWLKAAAFETDENKKWFLYDQAANAAAKMDDKAGTATVLQEVLNKKATPSKTDYVKCGNAWYDAGNYMECNKVYVIYSNKFPEDWRGPFMIARAHAQMDPELKTGAAAPYYEQFLALAKSDASTQKNQVEACMYLFAYSYNFRKDKAAAISYLDKVLAIDPGHADAKKYRELLSKPAGS